MTLIFNNPPSPRTTEVEIAEGGWRASWSVKCASGVNDIVTINISHSHGSGPIALSIETEDPDTAVLLDIKDIEYIVNTYYETKKELEG